MARKGEDVKLKAKPLRIDDIKVLGMNLPTELKLRITCNKGTYIRALARDIGQALGSGAHLTALRRTKVGEFSVDDCFTIESFEEWLGQQTIETDLD